MSKLSENINNLYKNFKQYSQFGTVPAVKQEENNQVPQNCFYKSVYYIDSVLGPVKDMLTGVDKDANASISLGNRKEIIKGRTYNAFSYIFANSLLALYTGSAYLAYLPHKLFSYLRETNGPKSLVEYTNNFQKKAEQHGKTCANFISSVLSYVISALIWTTALIVTSITWSVDKVSSKFSEMKEPENKQQDKKLLHNN